MSSIFVVLAGSMSEHIKLIGTFLVEIVIILVIFSVLPHRKRYPHDSVRYILASLTIVLIINTLFFFGKYFDVNIFTDIERERVSFLNLVFLECILFLFCLFTTSNLIILQNLIHFRRVIRIDRLLIVPVAVIIFCMVYLLLTRPDIYNNPVFILQFLLLFLLLISNFMLSIILGIKIKNEKINAHGLLRSYLAGQYFKYGALVLLILLIIMFRLYEVFEAFSFPLLILILISPYFFLGRKVKRKFDQQLVEDNTRKWAVIQEDYSFTDKEVEVIKMILLGKSNKDIESGMFISSSTVKNHLYNIYRKCKINSRLELSNLINDRLTN